MSQARRMSLQLGSVGMLAIFLYLLDRSLAQLEGYMPDEEYTIYTQVPLGLSFTCDDKIPGYYADIETKCQVWHWCVPSIAGNELYSFLCGPGTVFDQKNRVCDFSYKVDCLNSALYYAVNEDLYKDEEGNYIVGKKGNSFNNEYDRRRLTARRKRQKNIRVTKSTDKIDRKCRTKT